MFSWLRKKVKNAVLSGVQDAVDELSGQQDEPPPIVLRLPSDSDRAEIVHPEPKKIARR